MRTGIFAAYLAFVAKVTLAQEALQEDEDAMELLPEEPEMEPPEELHSFHQELSENPMISANFAADSDPVTVDIYLHIITSRPAETSRIDKMMKDSMDEITAVYESGNVKFNLKQKKYYRNATWAMNEDVDNMRQALHQGDKASVNVYAMEKVMGGKERVNGKASFPSENTHYPSRLWKEYVDVDIETFRGGKKEAGATFPHEVGHWLGLYHTFQGGCKGKGDMVSDTPAEERSFGCKPRTACNGEPADIHNIMSYSRPDCRKHFTDGQYDRIHQSWQKFRSREGKMALAYYDADESHPRCQNVGNMTRRPEPCMGTVAYCDQLAEESDGQVTSEECQQLRNKQSVTLPQGENITPEKPTEGENQPAQQPQDQPQEQPHEQPQEQPQDQAKDEPKDEPQDESQDDPEDESQNQAEDEPEDESQDEPENQLQETEQKRSPPPPEAGEGPSPREEWQQLCNAAFAPLLEDCEKSSDAAQCGKSLELQINKSSQACGQPKPASAADCLRVFEAAHKSCPSTDCKNTVGERAKKACAFP